MTINNADTITPVSTYDNKKAAGVVEEVTAHTGSILPLLPSADCRIADIIKENNTSDGELKLHFCFCVII